MNIPFRRMLQVLSRNPQAVARIHGEHDQIHGVVRFHQMPTGVLVTAHVTGLPHPSGFLGFHIHSGSQCTGTAEDPFANTLAHYNPGQSTHPNHAGDLPPLFGNHGFAFQVFFTDRFTVQEILHKTVVIHSGPDDFTSQPAGNVGKRLPVGRLKDFAVKCQSPFPFTREVIGY